MPDLYQPSKAIPLASAGDRWARVIEASSREASSLAAKAARNGGRLGVGDASKYGSLIATLEATTRVSKSEAKVAATALGPLAGELRRSLGDMIEQLPEHAEDSLRDLSVFLGQRGQAKVASQGALAALAARTTQNMTSDWTRLAESTRDGIVEATHRAMAAGLNPNDAARMMTQGVTDVGQLTYARANTIARTEMADLYDSARMGFMAGNPDVYGWTWRARPDACAICQIMHGQVFANDQPPERHHNCRCLIVPIPQTLADENQGLLPDAAKGARTGDYLEPGVLPDELGKIKRRPRHEITARLPKSWEPDLPLDLRTLVRVGDNPGWRSSRRLVRPRGPLRPPPKRPPLPPAPPPVAPPAPSVAPATPPLGEDALRAEAEALRAEFADPRSFGSAPQAKASPEQLAAAARVKEVQDAAEALDTEATVAEYAKQKARLAAANKALQDGDFTLAWQVAPSHAVDELAMARDYARIQSVGRKAREQARAAMPRGATDAQRAEVNRGLLNRLRGTGSAQPGAATGRFIREAKPPRHDAKRYGKLEALTEHVKSEIRRAHEVFPTEWLEQSADVLSRTYWSSGRRGYNLGKGQYIVVSEHPGAVAGAKSVDTAIHEIGHTFQASRPNVGRAEYAFWRARTGVLGRAGEYPALVGKDKAFIPKTAANPTPDWYTLKTYAFDGRPSELTSYEIFTTGVQQLLGGNWNYTGKGFGRMTFLDDDFEDWLWGVLLCL